MTVHRLCSHVSPVDAMRLSVYPCTMHNWVAGIGVLATAALVMEAVQVYGKGNDVTSSSNWLCANITCCAYVCTRSQTVKATSQTRRFVFDEFMNFRRSQNLQIFREYENSFTNLSHHRLLSSLRTDSTEFMTGPFLLSISVFCFYFLHYSFLFGSVRQIKLATRQLLGAR